ncbi:MAG TPA: hypothetical protein VL689_17210 [Paraburkholderia sp.]|jgi:hypothetical protein|nr:hypothetical protein [Paraburkholderia sp.]
MLERLAGDIGGLGAGWLFAWMLGALARLAASGAARARGHALPRCGRRAATRPARSARGGRSIALALLTALMVASIAAGTLESVQVVLATFAGAVCGSWFASRLRRPVAPRFVAAAGCALGAAAVAGGFAAHLLVPREDIVERGALYLAASLGAWMLAASASAWFVERARDDGSRVHRRLSSPPMLPAQSAFGDPLAYGLAVTLCVALAGGFMAADTSAGFKLAALVASCALASALGVRMMLGARVAAAGLRAVVARADADPFGRIGLVGIPDEWLVAACGGETFDATCLPGFGAAGGGVAREDSRDGAAFAALRRRDRGRYGSARRSGGRRAH